MRLSERRLVKECQKAGPMLHVEHISLAVTQFDHFNCNNTDNIKMFPLHMLKQKSQCPSLINLEDKCIFSYFVFPYIGDLRWKNFFFKNFVKIVQGRLMDLICIPSRKTLFENTLDVTVREGMATQRPWYQIQECRVWLNFHRIMAHNKMMMFQFSQFPSRQPISNILQIIPNNRI